MIRLLLTSVFLCSLSTTVVAQTRTCENSTIERNLNAVQSNQAELDKRLQQLSATSNKNKLNVQRLEQRNKVLCENIDSLKSICENLEKAQTADRTAINGKIQETNNIVASNRVVVDNRTLRAGIIAVTILFVLLVIFYYLTKRITSSINEIRKTQNVLQSAQTKMQEESIKLDNKLMELFEKQMPDENVMTASMRTDHSLALKVADEIVRIEMNLSRMDASIKGYKQLSKAVQRIKDNFNANGYEIVDMLGKPYNSGMKATVTFVIDENLGNGQQIITKIIKPQINYQQQMIQVAQIEVSQPE